MLSALLSPKFNQTVRERGEQYHRSGAVRILSYQQDGGEDFVQARVQGSENYTVRLVMSGDRSQRVVRAGCDCPYEWEGACKHVYATLRTLEARYRLPAAHAAVLEPLEGEDEWDAPFEVDWGKSSSARNGGSSAAGLMKQISRIFRGQNRPAKRPPAPPAWQQMLDACRAQPHPGTYSNRLTEHSNEPITPLYVFEEPTQDRYGYDNKPSISLLQPKVLKDGTIGKPTRLSLGPALIPNLSSDLDRHICLMLMGTAVPHNTYSYHRSPAAHARWELHDQTLGNVLTLIGQTGRLLVRRGRDEEPTPATWEAEPFEFAVTLEVLTGRKSSRLRGELRSASTAIPVEQISRIFNNLFRAGTRMGLIRGDDGRQWLLALMNRTEVIIPDRDRDAFLKKLFEMDDCPAIAFPGQWNFTVIEQSDPQPELLIATKYSDRDVSAEARFRYEQATVSESTRGSMVFDQAGRRAFRRRVAFQRQCVNRLSLLGFRRDCYGRLILNAKKLPRVLTKLVAENWSVLLDKKAFRTSTGVSVQVGTGIDWFDLNGTVDFGGVSATLPDILSAARRGEQFVRLSDGSFGMLPEEWLSRHGAALELASVEDGQIRYAKTQIGLIDALLTELPEARFDEQLAAARSKLRDFGGISSVAAPEGFCGELRPYQMHGLAWMEFLREFGWGGCLADDMGLGKTVQMLAQLLHHKRRAGGRCLAVVPKSVVFNWAREAARFAPELRVLDYTGLERHAQKEELASADLVLTTYGTLRRDIAVLRETEFEYVILDEAQAIKNPASQSAKAVRLLKATNRLALTGTPVENCIGDLWSIFEFLNPGMMGTVTGYKRAFKAAPANGEDGGHNNPLGLLQKMMRPFILRRTKQQVAPELPARSEQLVECELTGKQASTYGELRDHYRAALLGRLDRDGLSKSKVYVLEALLRLRQAACHPGLIDESRRGEEAAKLETLLPMLQELIAEGHKALVFSQFTSMLSIVRDRLDTARITYEYLDGQTTDRQARVDRFQNDPSCPLFLISLKAGGVGLNLTAAEYVFILDPWWNPAVEAQAIDRTHRIGQTRHVMAYRLIARNTVESKILELQQHKRNLAEAIITEANSLLQNLTREDLELLLS